MFIIVNEVPMTLPEITEITRADCLPVYIAIRHIVAVTPYSIEIDFAMILLPTGKISIVYETVAEVIELIQEQLDGA